MPSDPRASAAVYLVARGLVTVLAQTLPSSEAKLF